MAFTKGDRVLSDGEMGNFEGEVVDVDTASGYVHVLEDGSDTPVWCHPNELVFLGEHKPWLQL